MTIQGFLWLLGKINLAEHVERNPLIKMEFLSKTEKQLANRMIDQAESAQNMLNQETDDVFYVSIIPLRSIELELADVENTMWRIPSVNHGPPVSILMWQQWSSLTPVDLVGCRQRAIDGTFISKLHTLATTWTMKRLSASGTAKYKCESGVDVRIKLHLPTDYSRHENHKAMIWNYHKLYFCCRCVAS